MELRDKEINLSNLCALEQFCSFFEQGHIEQLARQSGFICRSSSRLSGEAFLKMMVQNIAPDTEWSLNDQCDYLKEHFGIELTKQSLDSRYHTFAVAFLKACYEAVLKKSLQTEPEAIKTSFSGIYLTDSTSFQLPANLAAFYASNGGSTTGASVKIHQTIELLQFKIYDLLLTDGKASDQNYWNAKGFELGAGNLWIADLGYFSHDTLNRIAKEQSFFLCRYKTSTSLYIKDGAGADPSYRSFDIEQYVKQMESIGESRCIEVYLGQQKIKSRLVCEKVPDSVKSQRLEKYRRACAYQSKAGKKKPWQKSKLKEMLCGYNIYLTNAPQNKLSNSDVSVIYGLRWQIELLFKVWKSLIGIDKIGQMSIFRFECFLYGRLLFVLLSTELMSLIRTALRDEEREVEISEWKTIKLIKKNSLAL